ncbi:hypothetical protein B0A52_09066 [Exophiala mesophila]|uniref:Uncharacterized protein n=1 Tax=Exophiala mesophila TaxID=212818 RepID=A0A438MTG0_EXOME|nr:hypothetical protein B0A52_09066 [Exophiala mesophila]
MAIITTSTGPTAWPNNDFESPVELQQPNDTIYDDVSHEHQAAFRTITVQGYDNNAMPGGEGRGDLPCDVLTHTNEVQVEDSFHLQENLLEIASILDGHPMVDYPTEMIKGQKMSIQQIVSSSWDRLATACSFLPDRGVHLCISRIIFHPLRPKDHCRINFLHARIFSQDWESLDGYHLTWKDHEVTFPKIFDTNTEFKLGGELFGPEDARIIIEDVPDAEPVIVFNMKSSQSDWKRAMWIFRPFSGHSTILTIRGTLERPKKEKNWTPLFIRDPDHTPSDKRLPSQYLYFVWKFEPLTVLKCHLLTGMCDVVFEQQVDDNLISYHEISSSTLRGGTEFVPIPRTLSSSWWSRHHDPNVQAFIAFPRTHVEGAGGCRQPSYRPELAVLVTNTTDFYLTYLSDPLDFGPDTVMNAEQLSDSCGKGRIMIANSIARWDLEESKSGSERTDVMTLTLSVDDSTVQVMRVSGIYQFLQSLPSLDFYFSRSPKIYGGKKAFPRIATSATRGEFAELVRTTDPFERASAVGLDLRACAEEAAEVYTEENAAPHGLEESNELDLLEKRGGKHKRRRIRRLDVPTRRH